MQPTTQLLTLSLEQQLVLQTEEVVDSLEEAGVVELQSLVVEEFHRQERLEFLRVEEEFQQELQMEWVVVEYSMGEEEFLQMEREGSIKLPGEVLFLEPTVVMARLVPLARVLQLMVFETTHYGLRVPFQPVEVNSSYLVSCPLAPPSTLS